MQNAVTNISAVAFLLVAFVISSVFSIGEDCGLPTDVCGANEFCRAQDGHCAVTSVDLSTGAPVSTGLCTLIPTATDCLTVLESDVCGCDGITYVNTCELYKKSLAVKHLLSCTAPKCSSAPAILCPSPLTKALTYDIDFCLQSPCFESECCTHVQPIIKYSYTADKAVNGTLNGVGNIRGTELYIYLDYMGLQEPIVERVEWTVATTTGVVKYNSTDYNAPYDLMMGSTSTVPVPFNPFTFFYDSIDSHVITARPFFTDNSPNIPYALAQFNVDNYPRCSSYNMTGDLSCIPVTNQETKCPITGCTHQSCCIPYKCETFHAPSCEHGLRANPQYIQCFDVCTPTECCNPKPLPYCHDGAFAPSRCQHGMKPDFDRKGWEIMCKQDPCQEPDCCLIQPRQTCKSFSSAVCDSLLFGKKPLLPQRNDDEIEAALCYDYPCQLDECCNLTPTTFCDTYPCLDMRKRSSQGCQNVLLQGGESLDWCDEVHCCGEAIPQLSGMSMGETVGIIFAVFFVLAAMTMAFIKLYWMKRYGMLDLQKFSKKLRVAEKPGDDKKLSMLDDQDALEYKDNALHQGGVELEEMEEKESEFEDVSMTKSMSMAQREPL